MIAIIVSFFIGEIVGIVIMSILQISKENK